MSDTAMNVLSPEDCELIRSSAGLHPDLWPDNRIIMVWKLALPMATHPHHVGAALRIAEEYDLDPLLGQVGFQIEGNEVVAITGRDTFLSVADRRDTFRGIAQGLIVEGDEWEGVERDPMDPFKVHIRHKRKGLAMSRDDIRGSYCVVFDAERPPVFIVRSVADTQHLHDKRTWVDHFGDMQENNAIGAALRRMYAMSRLLIEGESIGTAVEKAKGAAQKAEAQVHSLKERMQAKGRGVKESWAPEVVILSGKHMGKSWAEAWTVDEKYVRGIASRGHILDADGIAALRTWIEEQDGEEEEVSGA